jgi:hypothetical protein
MVFGDVYNERIQINEESLWAGERFNTNSPNSATCLRSGILFLKGKFKKLTNWETKVCWGVTSPVSFLSNAG